MFILCETLEIVDNEYAMDELKENGWKAKTLFVTAFYRSNRSNATSSQQQ